MSTNALFVRIYFWTLSLVLAVTITVKIASHGGGALPPGERLWLVLYAESQYHSNLVRIAASSYMVLCLPDKRFEYFKTNCRRLCQTAGNNRPLVS